MSSADRPAVTITPGGPVRGRLRVPGDKSISHRYALLAAVADGASTIRNYAPGADCGSTLRCLGMLGVDIRTEPAGAGDDGVTVIVNGRGPGGLGPARELLDAGNSGTTMRLLAGILAGCPGEATITGDASLRRRPMQRIVDPLQRMGARIRTAGGRPPLVIRGAALRGATYEPPVASAQVKSAILLAGLHAAGTTGVIEAVQTRDHTERALPAFGVEIRGVNGRVEVGGGQRPAAAQLRVPGDLSSAAFWAAAAAALPGSAVEIAAVGLNPTRTACLDLLRAMGADVTVEQSGVAAGEPFGTVGVRYGAPRALRIGASEVPGVIDELPALAAAACHGAGLEVRGAAELRAKESDRIAVLANGLRALGADIDERPDGFDIRPAALTAAGPTTITGHAAVDVSYPGFFEALASIRQSAQPA